MLLLGPPGSLRRQLALRFCCLVVVYRWMWYDVGWRGVKTFRETQIVMLCCQVVHTDHLQQMMVRSLFMMFSSLVDGNSY